MKFIGTHTPFSLLLVLITGQAADHLMDGQPPATKHSMASISFSELPDNFVAKEMKEELESERELKRMLLYVTPLMGIFQNREMEASTASRLNKRAATEMFEESRKRGAGRRPPMYNQYNRYLEEMQPDRSGYGGGYSSASGYGGGSSYGGGTSYGCCDKKDDLLPILALLALSLLLLYLIAIATTTVAARRRRRVAVETDGSGTSTFLDDNDLFVDEDILQDKELMDAPTWISMVDELWNTGEDDSDDSCTLQALCRMNRLALDSPGTTGMAVSLSSIPLSYLLHHREQNGFFNYLDASLMGRYGENCTAIFGACSGLN